MHFCDMYFTFEYFWINDVTAGATGCSAPR